MSKFVKYLLTGIVVLIAAAAVLYKYRDYVLNPWTRNGQVRARIIQITPRISGPIVQLPIQDNQFVTAGDLLFEIDPRTFQAAYDQANAQLDQTGANVRALEKQVEAAAAVVDASRAAVQRAQSTIRQLDATIEKNKAEYERRKLLQPKRAASIRSVQSAKANYEVSIQQRAGAVAGLAEAKAALAQSQAILEQTKAQLGALGDSNPQIRAALAAFKLAALNLEFTKVLAPVDGYVTNLNLRIGSQAVTNQPALALVDVASFWVSGFFKETAIARVRPGGRAVVTLMTYPDTPLEGRVGSIGWGIAQEDGSTGFELLPKISATFEWIRLAQRVPVRIHLIDVPQEIKLRVGTTCSVLVMTRTEMGGHVPPVPKALQ
jgi:multidrug resistance efflux pump